MKFLIFTTVLAFSFIYAIANAQNNPGIDPGVSGSISSSGAIRVINVQKSRTIGIQINSTVSGTVGTPTAVIQGSIDGVNYVTLPIKATGDATNSASLSSSGTFFLSEDDLAVNFVRVFYNSVVGGGALNIKEFAKVHKTLE